MFDNAAELSRDTTANDLRRLAMHCLLSTNKDKSRRRINKGKSIAWVNEKPDFEHYERASFAISRTDELLVDGDDTFDVWSLKFRYLSQKYPQPEKRPSQDSLAQLEAEFGDAASAMNDWGKGQLTTMTAYWSELGQHKLGRSVYEVPSYTKQEAERLDDLLVTGLIDTDDVGQLSYDDLQEIKREELVTERLDSSELWLSDLQFVGSTVDRLVKHRKEVDERALEKAKARRERKQARKKKSSKSTNS